MRRNAVFFFEVVFFGVFFGQVYGNLGKNPLHPQKFACSYTYDSIIRLWDRFSRYPAELHKMELMS